jgi:hypothetical protein
MSKQPTAPAHSKPASPGLSFLAALAFFLCLIGQSAYCYLRPIALFDTMAYVSLAEGHGENYFSAAGQECSVELRGPHSECEATTTEKTFKIVSSYSQSDFSTFLRFYRIKPLYTFLVFALRSVLHVTAYTALRIVSAASFLLIGLVLWFWLREYLSITAASITALLIANNPDVLGLGKRLLPDSLCTFLLMLAAYLLLHKKSKWPGILVLALLPLARTDLLIFAACFGTALIYLSQTSWRRKLTLFSLLTLACLIMQGTLSLLLHPLPWAVLFRHSFITWTDPSSFPGTKISLHEYLHALTVYGSKTILLDLPEAAFLATLALADAASWRPLRALVMASIATLAIRILLFPGMEVRYYVWFYLISAAAACSVLAQNLHCHHAWFARPQLELPPSS